MDSHQLIPSTALFELHATATDTRVVPADLLPLIDNGLTRVMTVRKVPLPITPSECADFMVPLRPISGVVGGYKLDDSGGVALSALFSA